MPEPKSRVGCAHQNLRVWWWAQPTLRICDETIAGVADGEKMLRFGRVFFEGLAQSSDELVGSTCGDCAGHFPDVFQQFVAGDYAAFVFDEVT